MSVAGSFGSSARTPSGRKTAQSSLVPWCNCSDKLYSLPRERFPSLKEHSKMSLNIPETRIEPKAVVAKVVTFFLKVLLGIVAGVLVAAVVAHALQMLHH
jgi:hypothetical protein